MTKRGASFFLCGIGVFFACSSGPAQGAEGGSCFPNGTCNAGLACLSNLCVNAAPDAGDSGAPDTGSGADTGAEAGDASAEAGAPDCTTYCNEIMANCTSANQQYTSLGSCMAVCATFPVGAAGDTSGDTLGCREYHGGAPSQSGPATHCAHAGPTGGDVDVTDTTPGTCGEGCEAFCALAQVACTGANQQFADNASCISVCRAFAPLKSPPYSVSDVSTNDWGCRMYHLTVAAESAANANIHCGHIGTASPVCTN